MEEKKDKKKDQQKGGRWIKIHIIPWFDGTLREDLTPAERSVWVDLLARRSRIYQIQGFQTPGSKVQCPCEDCGIHN